MQVSQVIDLVRVAFSVDASCSDRSLIEAALVAQGRVEAVMAGQRNVLTKALRRVSTAAESDLAAATRTDRREAKKSLERARLSDRAPGFSEALSDGEIRPEHLDRLGGALGRLDPGQGQALLGQPDLLDAARDTTPEEFDRELKRREREITADDGEALFERQRRAVRLRSWIDDDGMCHWDFKLDPLTGARFAAKLRAATEALFHSGNRPPDAPAAPRDNHEFLQAHALLNLVFGDGPTPTTGRPEITVVVDKRVPTGCDPVVDWGIPVDLPASALTDLAARANTHTVTVDDDTLIDAPGLLDVGRASRLATPAQRRALRALYATCAVPGCNVRFDYTIAHHIHDWLNGGLTNLDNLLPLCSRHHSQLHQERWRITLTPGDRQLTIRLPDGRVLRGRPNRATDTANKSGNPSPSKPPPPHAPPPPPPE